MRSSPFLLFTTLFFTAVVQAASGDEPRLNVEAMLPPTTAYPSAPDSSLPELGGERTWSGERGSGNGKMKNSDATQNSRAGARYGTGYEARQGPGSRGGRRR